MKHPLQGQKNNDKGFSSALADKADKSPERSDLPSAPTPPPQLPMDLDQKPFHGGCTSLESYFSHRTSIRAGSVGEPSTFVYFLPNHPSQPPFPFISSTSSSLHVIPRPFTTHSAQSPSCMVSSATNRLSTIFKAEISFRPRRT